MKKILRKMKNNIFFVDIIFVAFVLISCFILYLLNVSFRTWFIIFLMIVSVLGFIIGVIQLIKREFSKFYLVAFVLLILICVIPVSLFLGLFYLQEEDIIEKDGKKYVVITHVGMHHVDEYYYDLLGPFFRGRKVRIIGHKDSLSSEGIYQYTYYDESGKEKKKDNKNSNKNSYYLPPEESRILYEKQFENSTLRIVYCGSALGQKIGFCVLKSKDGGKNFYQINKNDSTIVSKEVKFAFLDETLGFAISTGDLRVMDSLGLYVTQDGGKTWKKSEFEYHDNYSAYLYVDSDPYFEDENLKFKWRDYKNNQDYIELTFISKDNGLTWKVESKKDMVDYE